MKVTGRGWYCLEVDECCWILNTPDICRKILMANGSTWNYMKWWIVLGSQ
jgi:hypothetical protein